MQGKKLLLTISSIVALSITTSAFAILSVPNGWYLEANAGSSKLSNSSYPGESSSSGLGGSGNLGYKFMPYVAAEIGYSQYANTSVKDSNGTKAATVKHYSYDLAAKGILPINDTGIEPFAKLGIQRINAHANINNAAAAAILGISSSQHSATGLYIGAGVQYYLMPELALNVQWARAEGNNSTGNEDLLSGGVSFIFD